jgi:hypothetical protein
VIPTRGMCLWSKASAELDKIKGAVFVVLGISDSEWTPVKINLSSSRQPVPVRLLHHMAPQATEEV